MDWIDRVLIPFVWVRGHLGEVGAPGGVFIWSLLGYALLLLVVAIIAHMLGSILARASRWSALRLARGASLNDLVRLESSSARISSACRWLGTRFVRTSYGTPDQVVHIPCQGDERPLARAVRLLLRSLWLLLSGLLAVLTGLPRFLMTAFGLSILVLALCTAFPDVLRDTAVAVARFSESATWSEASAITAVTVGAAIVPVAVIVTKVLVSEPAIARRSVRRRRNEAALEQLVRAETAIADLSYAVRGQMYDLAGSFETERRHAQQWFEWAQTSSRPPDQWLLRSGEHLECSQECLEPSMGTPPPRVYERNLQTAACAVEAAWSEGLNENLWTLARLMNGRARRGILKLRWCISSSGKFRMASIPSIDEWQRRRFEWQHGHLGFGGSTDSDTEAARTMAIRPTTAPETRWLEEDLLRLVWDLAELCRELSDLADYARALSRPRRFERIIRATE